MSGLQRNMFRFFFIGAVSLSVGTLAACGGDEDNDPSGTPDTGTDVTGDVTMDDTSDTSMEDDTSDTSMEDTTPDVTPDTAADTGTDTGTPGPVDQCLGDEDLAILWNPDIDATGEAQDCGLSCLGDEDPGSCAGTCVVEATGLSEGCAGCYAGVVVCSIQNCLAPCAADPTSEACTSCQAENCIDDYTACTGEIPDPPVTDACMNAADLGIIGGDEVDATGEAQDCGLSCLGDEDPGACSETCVVDATGLSGDCAGCYAGVVVCSIQNCLAPCAADPSSEACTSCQAENCLDDYYACTGPVESIEAVLIGDGRFETLLTAVGVAGIDLGDESGDPITLFAPIDDAFAAIPEADLAAILADNAQLTAVLTYHVVPGRNDAAAVTGAPTHTTAQGSDITVTVDGDTVMINDATILEVDLDASNGIVHVIDGVLLLPPN